jgi:hypothetical protein
MPADAAIAFEPRKTALQARPTVTVEAISEAAIQVLPHELGIARNGHAASSSLSTLLLWCWFRRCVYILRELLKAALGLDSYSGKCS